MKAAGVEVLRGNSAVMQVKGDPGEVTVVRGTGGSWTCEGWRLVLR